MKLGQAIKTMRGHKGISQGELANKVGISQTYLSLIECEHRIPTIETLEAIAIALEAHLFEIFMEEHIISSTKGLNHEHN